MTLSNLVTEERRQLFARIAEHLNSLASEIETETVTNVAEEPAGPYHQVDFGAQDVGSTDHQQPARPWSQHWPLFVGLLVIAGAVFWAMNYSFSRANLPPTAEPASQNSNQELAALLSGERAERKAFSQQLDALIVRLDSLSRDLDDL